MRSSVIGATGKLLWIWHELWVDDRLRATEEVLGVHVVGGSPAPFPGDVAARARAARVEPPEAAVRPDPAAPPVVTLEPGATLAARSRKAARLTRHG